MSTLCVKVVMIEGDNIKSHPNADALDIVTVDGWECVVRKGMFSHGDFAVYIPIDSVLSAEVEQRIFPPESKITLKDSRVRPIRIRGVVSQGLLVRTETLCLGPVRAGQDVAELIGVTKYEPPVKDMPATLQASGGSVRNPNPNFGKYTSLEHLRNYVWAFNSGEIEVTEKIHGTNFRAGWVKKHSEKWYEKVLRFFGFSVSEYVFSVGSHNCEVTHEKSNSWYKKNVYVDIAERMDLKNKLPKGYVIYGEIYGDGVQKNYNYGLENDIALVVFEVKRDGEWMDPATVRQFCADHGLMMVPLLYRGPFNMDKITELSGGDSVLCPKQKIREGVVVRSADSGICAAGRTVFKVINPEYLMQKHNTDWH